MMNMNRPMPQGQRMPYPYSPAMPALGRNGAPAGPSCQNTVTDKDLSLAMAYVPDQTWQMLYEPEEGFSRGTIFKELDKPLLGRNGK